MHFTPANSSHGADTSPASKECPNLGTSKCRCKDNAPASSCSCNSHKEVTGDMIAEITKKVMAELSK